MTLQNYDTVRLVFSAYRLIDFGIAWQYIDIFRFDLISINPCLHNFSLKGE